jgi:hypothetical protein
MIKFLLPVIAFVVAGCSSLQLAQTMLFLDDNGNVIKVDYLRSNKPYVTQVKSPFNGEMVDFSAKLLVVVTMPDGYDFEAWQTLNTLPSGTMYKSKDSRWLYHARGITSSVYEQTIDKSDYKLVYEGVMCSGGDMKKNRK